MLILLPMTILLFPCGLFVVCLVVWTLVHLVLIQRSSLSLIQQRCSHKLAYIVGSSTPVYNYTECVANFISFNQSMPMLLELAMLSEGRCRGKMQQISLGAQGPHSRMLGMQHGLSLDGHSLSASSHVAAESHTLLPSGDVPPPSVM